MTNSRNGQVSVRNVSPFLSRLKDRNVKNRLHSIALYIKKKAVENDSCKKTAFMRHAEWGAKEGPMAFLRKYADDNEENVILRREMMTKLLETARYDHYQGKLVLVTAQKIERFMMCTFDGDLCRKATKFLAHKLQTNSYGFCCSL